MGMVKAQSEGMRRSRPARKASLPFIGCGAANNRNVHMRAIGGEIVKGLGVHGYAMTVLGKDVLDRLVREN